MSKKPILVKSEGGALARGVDTHSGEAICWGLSLSKVGSGHVPKVDPFRDCWLGSLHRVMEVLMDLMMLLLLLLIRGALIIGLIEVARGGECER